MAGPSANMGGRLLNIVVFLTLFGNLCFGFEVCSGRPAALEFNVSGPVEGLISIYHDTEKLPVYSNKSVPQECPAKMLESKLLCWSSFGRTLLFYRSNVSEGDRGRYDLEYDTLHRRGQSSTNKLTVLKNCTSQRTTTLPATTYPHLPPQGNEYGVVAVAVILGVCAIFGISAFVRTATVKLQNFTVASDSSTQSSPVVIT
ncbi:uncharacterized protein [Lepisosteus oculatus]|uniref:uncharacterized protein isoform X2 n=1 Tax=Lepisosteus oculatus TaxID=7918 RepID=UPI00371E0E56